MPQRSRSAIDAIGAPLLRDEREQRGVPGAPAVEPQGWRAERGWRAGWGRGKIAHMERPHTMIEWQCEVIALMTRSKPSGDDFHVRTDAPAKLEKTRKNQD